MCTARGLDYEVVGLVALPLKQVRPPLVDMGGASSKAPTQVHHTSPGHREHRGMHTRMGMH